MAKTIPRHFSELKFPTFLQFFCLSFIYAVLAALLFQKLLIPLLPNLYAGNGLLKNDALVFHQQAVSIAYDIKNLGWSHWSLYPPGWVGNVGVLSGLYALWGPNPAYFIPIAAAAHALGATLIYKIGSLIWSGKIGLIGGLLAGVAFLIFPSSLQWYGQPLKDSFAISGCFLILLAWIQSLDDRYKLNDLPGILCALFLGLLLVAFVRPYFISVIAQGFFLLWVSIFCWILLKKQVSKDYKVLLRTLMIVCIILIAGSIGKNSESASAVNVGEGSLPIQDVNIEWTSSSIIPGAIERSLKRVALLRSHFIEFNREVGAGSAIDLDRQLHNTSEVIQYFPRALQIGLFSPFPKSWAERVTAPRVIAAIETSFWYLFAPGICFLIYRKPSKALLSCLVFCVMMIVILTIIHPNIGTLYRQRFGFWMFFMMCGLVGWVGSIFSLMKYLGVSSLSNSQESIVPTLFHQIAMKATTLAASTSLVMAMTFVCYLGFLARDLLLVDQFGMKSGLDGFFIAAMIPMVLVNCFSLPLGDTITNLLIRASGERLDSIVRTVMTFATLFLGAISALVIWKSNLLVSLFISQDSSNSFEQAASLLYWFTPILFLSSWTVVGNAVMNVLHFNLKVALAQLIVPVCSIGLILINPGGLGLYAATIGMLAGTLLNAIILFIFCHKFKINLMPTLKVSGLVFKPFLANYRWIILTAVLSAAITPLNFLYAGSVGGGAISMWAMSGKLTQFIIGLIAAAVTSVLLPHFARLKAKESDVVFRNQVFLILIVGSCIGSLFALIYCEFSVPIASILYLNTSQSGDAVNLFANLLRIGVFQMPPVICAGIIVKLTAATHTSSKSVPAIALGLAMNVLLDFLLVPSFGILGVGIAATVSSILSAAYLVLHNRKLIGFKLHSILILFSIWLICGLLGFLLT